MRKRSTRKSRTLSSPAYQPSKQIKQMLVINFAFYRNVVFDLDRFIEQVCTMFQNSKAYDAPMVLIEWIDQLHSSPSVNVIRYMKQLLHKFLSVIGAQEADQSPLGKKALEQLRYFLEDLKDASYRTL